MSHVAGGFPALRASAHFTSRVMGPVRLEIAGIDGRDDTRHAKSFFWRTITHPQDAPFAGQGSAGTAIRCRSAHWRSSPPLRAARSLNTASSIEFLSRDRVPTLAAHGT